MGVLFEGVPKNTPKHLTYSFFRNTIALAKAKNNKGAKEEEKIC